MKDQFAKALANIKEFWGKVSPKVKKLIFLAAGLVLTASIALTLILNIDKAKMQVLFPELSASETSQVYATLTEEMGVAAQINQKGEIEVPRDSWGELKVQLASKGYPQSAPGFGLYLDNTGFTRTDEEKRNIYLMDVTERVQTALVQSVGIKAATVFLTVPTKTGYILDENKEESSASVSIMMEPGFELTADRVSGVRNLIAYAVSPQIKPGNVKVIDASTGVEIIPEDGSAANANGLDFKRLEFEREMQRDIENNVKRLLSSIYGAEGVTAVAKVTLDYDKMLTEQREVVPQDNGLGVKEHQDIQYTIGGDGTAEGLPGEEDNTDTPTYPNQAGDGTGNLRNYSSSIDWENSYIKTQIEKGQAILKASSVSVVVDDDSFDPTKRDSLKEMISKGTGIKEDSISVTNRVVSATDDEEPNTPTTTPPTNIFAERPWLLIAIAGGLLLLVAVVIALIMLFRRKAKKQIEIEEEESATKIRDLQAEIDQHKKELLQNAQASNSKETAITNEIRDFAKENPEITASLIRSMLKEDE